MISEMGYNIYLTIAAFWLWWWKADNKQDELVRTILTVSVPTLLLLWYKWTISSSKNGTATLPPGPCGLPIVGYLPFLSFNLHEKFTEMGQKYGPIFSLRLGSKLHVVVNSMDLIKVVVRDMDQTFANRNPPLTAIPISYDGNDIAFSNNNAHWRNMRKLLATQVLNKANLNASKSFRTHEVRKTVNRVYNKIGKKININEITFNTEVNVVTSMLWGRSKTSEGDSSYIGDGFREVEFKMIELLGAPNISDFFPMLARFDLQGRVREIQRHFEFADRILENIIEERIKVNSKKDEGVLEEADGKKDFLQMLLELKDQKDEQTSLNIIKIKALLMVNSGESRIENYVVHWDIVVAATDTTSTMAEWVMAEILNDPRVTKKVQDELTTVIGITNILEESHLPKLTYLDAVIKETFRLHPPLPLLITRCPDETCIVGGYTIPKGTTVFMNAWAIHHDPQNWPDPFEFKPERFLNGTWDYTGMNLKFLPFGSGRRICPGMVLGEKMLMYILASLLHSFEWSLPKDEEFDLSDLFGVVTKKRKPLIAIPSQRLPDAKLYTG